MDALDILAASIETSDYILRKQEIMKWAEEELLDSLRAALASPGLEHGLAVHAQVSLGAVLRHGPLYHAVKHIRPDFTIIDAGRFPVAFVDYLGAGHDADFDGVKRAVAKKAQMAFIQVPVGWTAAMLHLLLLEAGLCARAEARAA